MTIIAKTDYGYVTHYDVSYGIRTDTLTFCISYTKCRDSALHLNAENLEALRKLHIKEDYVDD